MTRRDTWDTWLGKGTINPLYLIALHILHAAQHQARIQWRELQTAGEVKISRRPCLSLYRDQLPRSWRSPAPLLWPISPHLTSPLQSTQVSFQKQTQNGTRETPWSPILFGLLPATVPKIQAISIHTLQRILKVIGKFTRKKICKKNTALIVLDRCICSL